MDRRWFFSPNKFISSLKRGSIKKEHRVGGLEAARRNIVSCCITVPAYAGLFNV